jgi:tRNA (mo5U34)-methyltransferase
MFRRRRPNLAADLACTARGVGPVGDRPRCSEGWFAQRLLDWGARRVVGLDIREQNVRRATLLRDHYEIPAERLEFRQTDVQSLSLAPDEQFDVVLLLGLVYHLEDPTGAIRRRALTRSPCVIESQLTRQVEPLVHAWGSTESAEQAPGSFATRVEPDTAENPIASSAGVLSLIPNRVALEQMVQAAGFPQYEFLVAHPDHNPQYVGGHRAVLAARP